MKRSFKLFSLYLFAVLLWGCLPHEKLTGRVIDTTGPVPEAAVLGMVWIEDADKARPELDVNGLKSEEIDAALDKDMKDRGLPVAYARTFADKDGWFTLDNFHFSAGTNKAVKAMKQPKITRVTMWAFQRGYRKQAVTMFPKPGKKELPDATMLLVKPANWEDLYVENTVNSLTENYMLKGYSKEFGATKAEKSWIFEYTRANEQQAYDTSDIKSDKKLEELCGHDYSDIIVSTAGIQRNPDHEKCGELLKRIGAVHEVKELWIGHSNTKQDPLAAAKEVVKQALNTLPTEASEPKEYEAMILTGLEDAGKTQSNDAMRNGLSDQTWQDEAKLLYGKGDKAAAYKALGYALYWQLPAEIQQGILTAQLTLIAVPGIKDTAAGFYLLMTKPLTAQLPGGDDGNHKDKSKAEVKESTGTGKDTPLAKLDRELKQTKSTATAAVLIYRIANTIPETDTDVATLGQLMDNYPAQGQKAALKIKAPKLVKAVIKELDRQHGRLQAVRAKGKNAKTDKDQQDGFNSYTNSQALIQSLGNLRNTEAIPVLRTYLEDVDLAQPASIALGQLGDDASLNTMLGSIEKNKNVDLSGYGNKAFVKIIQELDKPGLSNERKMALINQIKGSRSPERKKALKELALHHTDEDVKTRSSQALLNAMFINPEDGDSDFLYEWLPKAVNDLDAGWALTALRIHFPDKDRPLEKRFIPVLIEILSKSEYFSSRSEAAQLLASCKIKEALPYLKKCISEDEDYAVRMNCIGAYYKLTGEVLPIFHPDDIKEFEKDLARPHLIEFYGKRPDSDPDKKFHLLRIKALKEYKRSQEQVKK
ncbi:MAG: HEAT repeat domain-containing protein [Elusimicrobiota bacterium]|nr:HEAT repeat domain-containing protein [Elusimicrobiota bacterium]